MGLAPYGKPKYVEKIQKLLHFFSDGSYQLDLSYFSYQYNVFGVYTKKFEEIFGKKNLKPDEVIAYYADIAASIQYVFEEEVVRIASYIQKKTKLTTLCYAGGAALNSKANWEIAKRAGFTELFIQPAAGDSGGALGAAQWAYHAVLGKKRTFIMQHAYYGGEESEEEKIRTLKKEQIRYKRYAEQDLLDIVSSALAKGKVIGWVQGQSEWGPRALGHRSILADPRTKGMKEIVNRKIKFREAFRPFAPVTLYEKAETFFSVGSKKSQSPFRFMLYVVPVKKEYRSLLGAITHEDGTARPQFIRKEDENRYYRLIQQFGEKTGIPVLLNTSFNLKGEPIVVTAHQALRTFYRSELDMLVLGDIIIKK
jgi:carbamoyltransferase